MLTIKVNFFEYNEVVYEAMGMDGPECNLAITQGIADIEKLLDDQTEWAGLQGTFLYILYHICKKENIHIIDHIKFN